MKYEGAPVMGRVSIVVPIYDRASMLGHLLRSVGSQTYSHIEVIVIDDGSDDLTAQSFADVTREVGGRHPVRYLRQSNEGVASARNSGIAASTGQYLYFLDSDDLIFPTAIAELVATLQNSDAPYCVARIIDIDFSLRGRIAEYHSEATNNILRSAEWCTHAALYKREAVLAMQGFDRSLRVGEDTIFQIRMRLGYGQGAKSPAIIGVRRRHAEGHLSLDRISASDRAQFFVVAASLIAIHPVFRNESRAVRYTSAALFLTIFARIRSQRTVEVQRGFDLIIETLLHDSAALRALFRWISARRGNFRLLAALLLISVIRAARSVLLVWRGRRSPRRPDITAARISIAQLAASLGKQDVAVGAASGRVHHSAGAADGRT